MKSFDYKKTNIYLLFCLVLLLSGCIQNRIVSNDPGLGDVSAQSSIQLNRSKIVIVDGLNREITLQKPASRVISLAPSNTEILFAINAGSQVIGRDTLSDYPEEVKKLPEIGGNYGEFDIERIVSLQPDLVLATSLNPQELVKKLEDLDITVVYIQNPIDLEGMFENILTVAKLTGHTQDAELLVTKLNGRVEEIKNKISNIQTRPVVFYEVDGTDASAPWTSGKGTFIDTLITMAGGENLGARLNVEWAQISIEEIISQDPDLILIGDAVWGGVTVDAVKSRPGWDTLSAVKNNRVYEFDDNIVSRPGPRLIDGLESLAKLLHPELFY
ncbi:MAG: cobalamin-binding protein [Chloroflexi bacterium]|nr:cobalamin-binding protein [Chloroflexota bacterium]